MINGAGLVGKVEKATGGSAVVTLITDPEFATGGIAGAAQEPGTVVPSVNTPGELLFKFVDNATKVRMGELVYTAGTISSRLESRYPPAIPIGTRRRRSTSATASSTAASTSSRRPTSSAWTWCRS